MTVLDTVALMKKKKYNMRLNGRFLYEVTLISPTTLEGSIS